MAGPTVAVTALSKSYGGVPVVNDVSFSVGRGEIFALLGPNGAGKTTTVRMLATLTDPGSGTALVAGFDVRTQRAEVRQRISLTGQYAALDEALTGRENLHLVGRLRHLNRHAAAARADELLTNFALRESADRRVSSYSGGMRRRLDLAAGLVIRPEVVFLDEPTTGLDPRSRQALWDVVQDLAAGGVTVLLTTQYLDEADRLADRVAVLNHGWSVAEGTPAELKRRVAAERLELTLTDSAAFGEVSRLLGNRILTSEPAVSTISIGCDGSATSVRTVLDRVDPTRELISRFAVRAATLDDVFLSLTEDSRV